MAKLDQIITALEGILEAQHALSDRVLDLEKPAIAREGTPIVGHAPTEPKRTRIVSASPELQALRGQIKRSSKADLIDKCAGHSREALITMQLAGSSAAREFMRGEREAATQAEEYAHVPGLVAHQYITALLGGASPAVASTRKAKAQPKGKVAKATATKATATPKAKNGNALSANLTDAQLLRSRPKGASQAPAAIRTWVWRTRERIAGRDPMRSRA